MTLHRNSHLTELHCVLTIKYKPMLKAVPRRSRYKSSRTEASCSNLQPCNNHLLKWMSVNIARINFQSSWRVDPNGERPSATSCDLCLFHLTVCLSLSCLVTCHLLIVLFHRLAGDRRRHPLDGRYLWSFMPRPESGAALEPKSTFKQMSLSSTVCLLVTKEKEVMLKQKTS